MTQEQRDEITRISKEFAEPFYEMTGGITGSGFLIVDPLSAYLSSIGYKNKCMELPATVDYGQILIIQFEDGDQFVPAGGDLKRLFETAENWQWL